MQHVWKIDRAATCDSHSSVWLGTAFVQSCSNVFQGMVLKELGPQGILMHPQCAAFSEQVAYMSGVTAESEK